MELPSKGAGKMISNKVMEKRFGLTELFTKDNIRTVKSMEKENSNGQITPHIKDSLLIIISMDLESISGRTPEYMREQ